jgi:long-chain acyl-CoA synthetase
VDFSPGDRVALLVPGSAAYVDLVLVLLRRGVVPIPLDPGLTPSEREALFDDLRPGLLLTEPEDVQHLLTGLPVGHGPPRGRPMHVTSGTTGRPKGVWSGVLEQASAEALVAEERALWGFCAADVNLVLSPLHHSAPLRFAMGTRLAGGRVVVPGPFDPAVVSETIERERPTTMFCVPAHLQRLFAHWDVHGTPDLTCFRLVAHAGAPCPGPLKRRLIDAFPDSSTWEFYGSTEGQFTACRSEEWLQRPGTVGQARPGRTMSVTHDGLLWCTVPEAARFSYFRDPEKTGAAWRETADGPAFTVGDLGRIDDEGYVYLDGRREDLVISGGVNVYPAEVEDVLSAAPGVQDVAVFGLDDERWGQRVCAAVVGTTDVAGLASYARERLAPAKRPKDWFLLDALPRTSTGKVRRLDLPGLVAGPGTARATTRTTKGGHPGMG